MPAVPPVVPTREALTVSLSITMALVSVRNTPKLLLTNSVSIWASVILTTESSHQATLFCSFSARAMPRLSPFCSKMLSRAVALRFEAQPA